MTAAARAFAARSGTIVIVGVAIFVIAMLVVGIDLWTDAIWYHERRLRRGLLAPVSASRSACSCSGTSSRCRPARQPLAGRPARSRRRTGERRHGPRLDRPAQRGRRAQPAGARRRARGSNPGDGARGGRVIDVTPMDMPDPTPLGRVIIAVVAVLIALTIGASIAVELGDDPPLAEPGPVRPGRRRGRRRPGLRPRHQLLPVRPRRSCASSRRPRSRIVVAIARHRRARRYLVGGLAGSPVFSTPVRVHLGVLGGLILMLMAVGYQLDKFELVYSTRGVATGVSYTDANAQFIAYDVLTGLSAIAAAFLVGGAFTRVMWPLGADDRGLVHRLDRHRPDLSRVRPADHGHARTSRRSRRRTSRTTSR